MQRSRLWILALGTFALGTDVFVIAGILPAVSRGVHVSLSATGFLVTVFAMTYAIGSPILASTTGSIPRKILLIFALGMFVLANIVAAVTPNYLWLLIARVAAAAAAAVYTPTATAVAVSLVPPALRGRALATVLAGLTAAIVFGVPIGTVIGTLLSWRWTFGFVATLAGLATIGIAIFLPETAVPEPVRLMERIQAIRRPHVAKMLCLTILWTMGAFTVYTYIAPFLHQSLGFSGSETSGILLWWGLTAMVGNHLGGVTVDRWGAQRTLTLGLGVVAFVLGTLHWTATTVFGAIGAIGLWGIGGWILQVPQQHRLMTLVPTMPTAILAWNASATYLGMAAGAALGGYFVHHALMTWLGYIGAGCELLALALHFFWTRTVASTVASSS